MITSFSIRLGLVLLVVCYGCSDIPSSTWKVISNNPALDSINTCVVRSLYENEFNTLPPNLIISARGFNTQTLASNYHKIIDSKDFDILANYFIEIKNPDSTLGTIIDPVNKFQLHYLQQSEKMYLSLLTSKDSLFDYLLYLLYTLSDSKWTLIAADFGPLKFSGNNAIHYYQLAQEEYEKGYLINTINYLSVSKIFLKPIHDYLEYEMEGAIEDFITTTQNKLSNDVEFPVTIKEIETKPQILKIYPKFVDYGCYPMVEYLTRIDLIDTNSTRIENLNLQKLIGKYFPGIDVGNKHIYYRAFNSLPKSQEATPYYGFSSTLE